MEDPDWDVFTRHCFRSWIEFDLPRVEGTTNVYELFPCFLLVGHDRLTNHRSHFARLPSFCKTATWDIFGDRSLTMSAVGKVFPTVKGGLCCQLRDYCPTDVIPLPQSSLAVDVQRLCSKKSLLVVDSTVGNVACPETLRVTMSVLHFYDHKHTTVDLNVGCFEPDRVSQERAMSRVSRLFAGRFFIRDLVVAGRLTWQETKIPIGKCTKKRRGRKPKPSESQFQLTPFQFSRQ